MGAIGRDELLVVTQIACLRKAYKSVQVWAKCGQILIVRHRETQNRRLTSYFIGEFEVRVLGSYCNRGRETSHLSKLITRARSEHIQRSPVAEVVERARFSKLSKPVRAEILARYQQGERVVDLAAAFGVSEWSVQNLRKGAGVEPHPRGMSQAAIDEAAELYAQGLSFSKIGRQVGYDPKTVAKELRARGLVS